MSQMLSRRLILQVKGWLKKLEKDFIFLFNEELRIKIAKETNLFPKATWECDGTDIPIKDPSSGNNI
jgi:hypothetical protein